jgi:hypothetical protein
MPPRWRGCPVSRCWQSDTLFIAGFERRVNHRKARSDG